MKREAQLERGTEIASLFCRLYLNTKRELPIRSSQMGLLILTVNSGAPVTPVEAARFFKVKKPMVTAMVHSLEQAGYLTKQPSPEDKRSYRLVPTPKAVRLVQETYGEYHRIMETLYDEMGRDDYNALIALLARANDILEKGRA